MLHQPNPPSGRQSSSPPSPWPGIERGDGVVACADTADVSAKAAAYLEAGVPLNLSGPAGIGKTTLALRLARDRGRPVSFVVGHAWLGARDFTGREVGQSTLEVVDRFVQSVRRTESQTRADFRDSVLVTAMERGHTLVYDEFTRASAEANATLLPVLEEGVLVQTDAASERVLVRAHPEFRLILTSNPHDYVGVADAPDALLDRIVTLILTPPSSRALAAIVSARSGLDPHTSAAVVAVAAAIEAQPGRTSKGSMRAAILIARIVAHRLVEHRLDARTLTEIACDVFRGRGPEPDPGTLEPLVADLLAGGAG